MMPEWAVEILNKTVREELRSLPADCQAKFALISRLLIIHGPQHVGMPYVRPLREKLWEMRLRGEGTFGRAIYIAVPRRRLVVLHAFVKKTGRVPKRAIELALQRKKEIGP